MLVKFQTIQSANPGLIWQQHDGFIGLGPGKDDTHPSFIKDTSSSLVNHQIVSMYITNETDKLSHIKFGGWDEIGMKPGE